VARRAGEVVTGGTPSGRRRRGAPDL